MISLSQKRKKRKNRHGGTGEPLAPLWGASEADKRREAHARSLAGGNGFLAGALARAALLSRRALLSALLVVLVLLEAARNAGWQARGVKKVLEANRRAKEEHGRSAAAAAASKGGKGSPEEATASAEVRVGSGNGATEGKKKA